VVVSRFAPCSTTSRSTWRFRGRDGTGDRINHVVGM
jgi:hypothetical protein